MVIILNFEFLSFINKPYGDLCYFLIYLLVINLIGFLTMHIDKKKAINKKYRISEKFIFFIGLILGATGVYIGMYKFRHKTKHNSFTVGIPVLIIINIMSTVYIIKDLIF